MAPKHLLQALKVLNLFTNLSKYLHKYELIILALTTAKCRKVDARTNTEGKKTY